MAQELLTEKYRPQNLDDLIVPDRIMKLFEKGVQTNMLFYGTPGTGKCVTEDTLITVRNKKTQEIEKVTIGEFHKRFLT